MSDKVLFLKGYTDVFDITKTNEKDYLKIKENNFPLIVITKFSTSQNTLSGEFVEQLNMPFGILDFEKKIVSLFLFSLLPLHFRQDVPNNR